MVSSQLNVFAGVLTNDFYRAFLNPKATERALARTGRVFTVLLGALLVTSAILVPHMGGAEKLIISINSLLAVPLFAPTLWGLFSRKIGLREMIIVAITSFSIGLALRFGLASNPLIQEGDPLWPIASFLAANTKNVEVLVGVILPVLMLAWIQWRKQGVDQGAVTLQAHRDTMTETSTEGDTPAPFDPFPARMVMISLLVIGLGMLLLGALGDTGRSTLLAFGGVLVFLSGLIQRVLTTRHP